MRETDITKDMRTLEGIKSMDETNEKVHEENWQKESAHIEQRRRDLLSEHEQCRRCLKQSRVWRISWHRSSVTEGMNKPELRLKS